MPAARTVTPVEVDDLLDTLFEEIQNMTGIVDDVFRVPDGLLLLASLGHGDPKQMFSITISPARIAKVESV